MIGSGGIFTFLACGGEWATSDEVDHVGLHWMSTEHAWNDRPFANGSTGDVCAGYRTSYGYVYIFYRKGNRYIHTGNKVHIYTRTPISGTRLEINDPKRSSPRPTVPGMTGTLGRYGQWPHALYNSSTHRPQTFRLQVHFRSKEISLCAFVSPWEFRAFWFSGSVSESSIPSLLDAARRRRRLPFKLLS
jgi:hypothetical protein